MQDSQAFRDLMLVESPAFEEVMVCVFGVQNRETACYLALLHAGEATVADLADELDRDRSNVTRSLAALRGKDLVERRRELLDAGGHVYHYEARPLSDVKAMMHEELDAWADFVHGTIESFGAVTR